jgi:hypothetical protein
VLDFLKWRTLLGSYQSKVVGALLLTGVLLVSGNIGKVNADLSAGWGGGGTDYELLVD